MLRKVMTASLAGVDADFVMVEVDLQVGLPGINVVGLADTTIKEAKERIKSAISNSGFEFPRRKLTINLSPAALPKEGSHFDLPIAVGILGTEDSEMQIDGYGFMGELSLDGALKSVRGALSLAMRLRDEGIRRIILPEGNAQEAALLSDVEIYPVKNLRECIDILTGKAKKKKYIIEEIRNYKDIDAPDFADVIGQEAVKRSLIVAASGNHGLLMIGNPGSGKSMMAKRLPNILPDMTYDEMLEVVKIHSAAGHQIMSDNAVRRPFRSPHHTITKAALVGGGRTPQPGELSLAHNGILFLDEFSEFSQPTIELLRQPIEDGFVSINRARKSVQLPSRIMLVAAANPCKCGYFGDDKHKCTCSENEIQKYFAKFSAPMLDRIDMHISVSAVTVINSSPQLPAPPYQTGCVPPSPAPSMSTAEMKAQVQKARAVQKARYEGTGIRSNADLTEQQIQQYCLLTPEAKRLVEDAFNKMNLSMRSYYKILRIARTIADLEAGASEPYCSEEPICSGTGSVNEITKKWHNLNQYDEKNMEFGIDGIRHRVTQEGMPGGLIQIRHVAEALNYRGLERFYRRDIDGR